MLARLNGDRLTAWHRERWVPQNVVVSIAGAVDPGDAEPVVRSALSGWTRTTFVETAPQARPPDARSVHVLHRPGSVQTALMLGGPAPVRADSEYLPMLVANMALGGLPGSRMVRVMREERGLSHNATSNVVTYRTGGFWLAYGDVATHRTAEALDAVLGELKRLAQEPIPAAEIDDARRAIVGRFALNLEQLPQIATNLALRRVEGLSADYWDRFPDAIQAVTAEDVRRVAAKYMDVAKAQIVAVGSQDDVVPLLKPYGPILFYDVEGKLIEKR
jgi:predicted Zn-dependent peptidase